MRIQHNIMAMNAYRNYTNNTSAVAKNLEKLSSGYRINRAGDDAAGLAISEKMRAQITGLSAAQKNVKDGISLVKTAEGATQEIHDMLNRMVYLAEQSANGTYQDEVDREAITNEFEQLKSEIDRIADSSNFNGIKLLDGSLAGGGSAASSVKLGGNVEGYDSDATKGVYEAGQAFEEVGKNMAAGDTFNYTIGLDDGTSYTATLTMKLDDTGKATIMVGADGTEYTVTEKKPTVDELTAAAVKEFKKTALADKFTISGKAGKFTLTAKEAGDQAPAVNAMDVKYVVGGIATAAASTDMGVKTTSALGNGVEIKAEDLVEYDGTNYEDAVFTINGKKFVLLTETMDGTTTGNKNDEYLRAVQALGKDVTVLVGGTDGLTAGDGNFNQNVAKIAEVTGLTVTDAVDESAFGANDDTGVAAGEGIRLSAGKGSTGGLTLQIGDTSDDFNQLRVSIKDMHVKALGLDKVSLGTQSGAQAAVSSIKDAINYVSDVRGTLGATQNRLEHTSNNLSVMKENIQDAESSIRDTDIAEEMMAYTKNNILVQSAQAMLAQANQVPQGVLQLLG